MKITFLGTGTSTGVPQMGCHCDVCSSKDPRDTRLRCSAMIEVDEQHRFLLDCGPDFRQQMLRYGFKPFNAVLITHEHYDHVGGIDDLRPQSMSGKVRLFADDLCAKHLRERLPYCFSDHLYPGVPQLDLRVVSPGVAFDVDGVEILPLRAFHDRLPILSFRIGNIAYLTDITSVTDDTINALMDVPLLVVNALRHTYHHSHQTLAQAIALSEKVRAKRTYFIHMSHEIGRHEEVEKSLPVSMHLAYDGLEVEV